MANKKQYAAADTYEKKLSRVMERFGIKKEDYEFNWDRFGAWIKFFYKGVPYKFEYTLDIARSKGKKLTYGSDCFSMVVLMLERLAKMVEDGTYELQQWIGHMKFLPPLTSLPMCFQILGFTVMPTCTDEIDTQYKKLAMIYHPDRGGDAEDFDRLVKAKEQAEQHLSSGVKS